MVPQSLVVFFPHLTEYLGRTLPIPLELFAVCLSPPETYHINLFPVGSASLSDLDLHRVPLPALWPGNTLGALTTRPWTLLIHFLFLWLSEVPCLINCVHCFPSLATISGQKVNLFPVTPSEPQTQVFILLPKCLWSCFPFPVGLPVCSKGLLAMQAHSLCKSAGPRSSCAYLMCRRRTELSWQSCSPFLRGSSWDSFRALEFLK